MSPRIIEICSCVLLCALPVLQGCCPFLLSGEETEETSTEPEGPEEDEEAPASAVQVESVVFARALDEDWQPEGGAVTEFRADETEVWTRITLEGRPRTGQINLVWMWRDTVRLQTSVDLSEVNGGVLFSFGEDTFIRGSMIAPLLYQGEGNRLVIKHGEVELGSYSFTVVAPEGARPSRLVSSDLFANDPRVGELGPPVREFGPQQVVYVAVTAELGWTSWLDANFIVGDLPPIIKESIGEEGGGDPQNLLFEALPEGGWPPGTHRVELVLNDNEVAEYEFTVTADAEAE